MNVHFMFVESYVFKDYSVVDLWGGARVPVLVFQCMLARRASWWLWWLMPAS